MPNISWNGSETILKRILYIFMFIYALFGRIGVLLFFFVFLFLFLFILVSLRSIIVDGIRQVKLLIEKIVTEKIELTIVKSD